MLQPRLLWLCQISILGPRIIKGNTQYTCYDVRNKQGTQYESKRHDYQKIDRHAKGLLGENALDSFML